MNEPEEKEGEPECGYGRCVREHPLHCCHTATGVSRPSGRPELVLRGWRCVFCGKESRTWTLCHLEEEPQV